jgi:hypothetical protein
MGIRKAVSVYMLNELHKVADGCQKPILRICPGDEREILSCRFIMCNYKSATALLLDAVHSWLHSSWEGQRKARLIIHCVSSHFLDLLMG